MTISFASNFHSAFQRCASSPAVSEWRIGIAARPTKLENFFRIEHRAFCRGQVSAEWIRTIKNDERPHPASAQCFEHVDKVQM